MSRDEYSHLDQRDGLPRTPRQKTQEYRAMITIEPRRETYVKPADPWMPLYISVALTGVLVVALAVWVAL